jgi:hypothetical protein
VADVFRQAAATVVAMAPKKIQNGGVSFRDFKANLQKEFGISIKW